ncbi:MAG: SDR family oxidoreductase [Bacteroidales bacterium]|nr:SDR family oxidoreductase [Bacteroidales bacterium]
MDDLKNKTILVTGASSGIGKECAILASKEGANIIITGRNVERLKDTFEKLDKSGNHKLFAADLCNQSDVDSLILNLPKLDGIVFSAGVSNVLPAKFIRKKHIDETMDLNFNSVVLLTAGILSKKLINNNASLVFISSAVTKYPYVGASLYIAGKMALDGYVKVLALELAAKKIRCNTISPNFVKTPLLGTEEQLIMEEAIEKHKNIHPLGMGMPEDVANAAVYLLSEKAKWLTGTNLFLGGGI